MVGLVLHTVAKRRAARGEGGFGAGPGFTFSRFRVSGGNVFFKLQVPGAGSGIADAFAEFFVIRRAELFQWLKNAV